MEMEELNQKGYLQQQSDLEREVGLFRHDAFSNDGDG